MRLTTGSESATFSHLFLSKLLVQSESKNQTPELAPKWSQQPALDGYAFPHLSANQQVLNHYNSKKKISVYLSWLSNTKEIKVSSPVSWWDRDKADTVTKNYEQPQRLQSSPSVFQDIRHLSQTLLWYVFKPQTSSKIQVLITNWIVSWIFCQPICIKDLINLFFTKNVP